MAKKNKRKHAARPGGSTARAAAQSEMSTRSNTSASVSSPNLSTAANPAASPAADLADVHLPMRAKPSQAAMAAAAAAMCSNDVPWLPAELEKVFCPKLGGQRGDHQVMRDDMARLRAELDVAVRQARNKRDAVVPLGQYDDVQMIYYNYATFCEPPALPILSCITDPTADYLDDYLNCQFVADQSTPNRYMGKPDVFKAELEQALESLPLQSYEAMMAMTQLAGLCICDKNRAEDGILFAVKAVNILTIMLQELGRDDSDSQYLWELRFTFCEVMSVLRLTLPDNEIFCHLPIECRSVRYSAYFKACQAFVAQIPFAKLPIYHHLQFVREALSAQLAAAAELQFRHPMDARSYLRRALDWLKLIYVLRLGYENLPNQMLVSIAESKSTAMALMATLWPSPELWSKHQTFLHGFQHRRQGSDQIEQNHAKIVIAHARLHGPEVSFEIFRELAGMIEDMHDPAASEKNFMLKGELAGQLALMLHPIEATPLLESAIASFEPEVDAPVDVQARNYALQGFLCVHSHLDPEPDRVRVLVVKALFNFNEALNMLESSTVQPVLYADVCRHLGLVHLLREIEEDRQEVDSRAEGNNQGVHPLGGVRSTDGSGEVFFWFSFRYKLYRATEAVIRNWTAAIGSYSRLGMDEDEEEMKQWLNMAVALQEAMHGVVLADLPRAVVRMLALLRRYVDSFLQRDSLALHLLNMATDLLEVRTEAGALLHWFIDTNQMTAEEASQMAGRVAAQLPHRGKTGQPYKPANSNTAGSRTQLWGAIRNVPFTGTSILRREWTAPREWCRYCAIQGVTLKTCSRCKKAKYCSYKCHKEDWELHKEHCSRE